MKTDSRFKRMMRWVWRKKWWIVTLAVVVFGAMMIFGGGDGDKNGQFATVAISRGGLRQVVTAVADGANAAESAADFLNA